MLILTQFVVKNHYLHIKHRFCKRLVLGRNAVKLTKRVSSHLKRIEICRQFNSVLDWRFTIKFTDWTFAVKIADGLGNCFLEIVVLEIAEMGTKNILESAPEALHHGVIVRITSS